MEDNQYKSLIGKILVEDDAPIPCDVPSSQVVRHSDLPEKHRIIKPGMVYTTDFVEDRLNVKVKEDGLITAVHYG
ncbi:hypothetical protein THASP1DRAFT_31043 [Thamnocephalis sphaerospora]|uniref:Peptidase inhibitor I78 family-domain-containing protein n=1 Tax=Thamnocephalis sphaerospora TaxID=78915 RepID=A0A4P9XMM4_9FUNG|nr:hypothetical protein THASP1DRAFT_31043 [Thamnocephalis sphaerospora]|eukprot:RKP07145.1 hypothetical protein THASP1DRAFT_31043 [Thamnocephalis sphaerospora]